MTTRETPFAPGTPCWVDLFSSDTAKAKDFYGDLFGWSAHDAGPEFGNYVTFESDGHVVAGMMANDGSSGTPDGWTTYLAADDIATAIADARSAGAQVVTDAMQVGDEGSMAVLVDPAGAAFGLWQAGNHKGFGKYNEPGSVTWDELHTKDFAAATAFYAGAFGWDYEAMADSDEFRYSTALVGGETVAGLLDASASLAGDAPSQWTVYLSVADADAAVARAVELGGTVTSAPQDSPFGRMADLLDPTGAAFKLHQALPEG